MQAILLNY